MPTLTELLGTRLAGNAGRIADLAVRLDREAPVVTALLVRPGARRVPWAMVAELADEVRLRVPTDRLGAGAAEPGELLLARHVLDSQILDAAGGRLRRVGDVELAFRDGELLVAAVEVGAAAILRRLGLRRLAGRARVETVDWEDLHLVSGPGYALQLTPAGAVHTRPRRHGNRLHRKHAPR